MHFHCVTKSLAILPHFNIMLIREPIIYQVRDQTLYMNTVLSRIQSQLHCFNNGTKIESVDYKYTYNFPPLS